MKRCLFATLPLAVMCTLSAQTTAPAAAQDIAPKPPVVLHPTFPTGNATPLGAAVAAIVSAPDVSRAHWGIAVTRMDGTPLLGLHEGELFRPASNAKLFTTAAAMALLGPEHTFTTRIYGKLDATTGVVDGDLHLVGAGDANLDSGDVPYIAPSKRPKGVETATQDLKDLASLADQLVAKGVKRIAGSVLGDDRRFPHEPYPKDWDADDLLWGYGAPVSALTLHDNQLKLTVTHGTISGPAGRETYGAGTVVLEQFGVPYYTVKGGVQTLAAGAPATLRLERNPGSRTLLVSGGLAVDAKPDVEFLAIDDPAEFAAMALEQMLTARGVVVDGAAEAAKQKFLARGWTPEQAASAVPYSLKSRQATGDGVSAAVHQPAWQPSDFLAAVRAPNGCIEMLFTGGACGGNHMSVGYLSMTVLAEHTSPTVGQDVVLTMKVSQNLHAELLLHHLGEVVLSGYGSTLDGAQMVRSFAIHAGVDPDDFLLYDGSGLSGHDLVTPRATAKLLSYATTQSWFPDWKAALPVGGVDGSLASRFSDKTGLAGKVFAKTGTLGESRALSGYLIAKSGQMLIFSVMVDTHMPGTSADREAMDEIVMAIADAN